MTAGPGHVLDGLGICTRCGACECCIGVLLTTECFGVRHMMQRQNRKGRHIATYENALIAFVNESTVLTDGQVDLIRRAISYQVTYQFAPSWHTGARTLSIPKGTAPPSTSWQVIFRDDSDQPGALGYHDLTASLPLAYVFARTCETNSVQPSSCASHEVLEMLGDPLIDMSVQVGASTFYAYEACDAVEQADYVVSVKDALGATQLVLVSDFVTPAWFAGTNGPWDFLGKLTGPRKLLPGGSYIGVWTPSGGWTQHNADGSIGLLEADDARRPTRCLRPSQRAAKHEA